MITQTEKYQMTIVPDDYAESPREWDNLCTIAAFHKRYNIGDNDIDINYKDFNSWDEMEKHILKKDVLFCLPVYMYDHGGISISTTPFSCKWDSGQVGFIFVEKSKVRYEYSVKKITKELKEKVMEIALDEIETLNQYLSGDVWTVVIEDESGDMVFCSGFYGYENAKQSGIETLNNLYNK